MKEVIGQNDILVIGSSSMVGSRVVELLREKLSFFKNDIDSDQSFDITNAEIVNNLILQTNPDLPVLHFAAYTDVDQAERERNNKNGKAWLINVQGTENLVSACQKIGKKIVYISTDFVFDGKKGPYSNDDQPAISSDQISWYGWTKLQGERRIQAADLPFLILRISYPYRAKFDPKTDFIRNIINKLEANKLYPMFDDQYLTPTFIDDLSNAIEVLLDQNATGIYHVAIPEVVTPYQVATKVADVFGFSNSQIDKASFREFRKTDENTAPRPQYGGLKIDKISQLISLSNLEESLLTIKNQLGKL